MKERVIIAGVETPGNSENFLESMNELKNLTETVDGEVVGSVTQKREAVDRRTILGKGRLQDLATLVNSRDAELVIFNQELTSRQNQSIADAVGARVIDRVQLILDIFAMRAKSKEGKLQVELAQLNYLLPRLVGKGVELSRLGGGIGTRGPGETQLETDRRHIRRRITSIKRELKAVSEHRERSRQKRLETPVFQVGLIGYTNAGKSTIMNLLTAADTFSEDQLFATLDPLTKQWRLPSGFQVTLTDTVGFIQDLPTQLIEAFQSTLEESRNMDLLLHVVDAAAPGRDQQEETVLQLLSDLEMDKIPLLTVYNKMDLLPEGSFVPTLFPNVCISALAKGAGAVLTEAIQKRLMEIMVPYEGYVSMSDVYVISRLKQETILLFNEFDEEKNSYQVKGFAPEKSQWLRRISHEMDR